MRKWIVTGIAITAALNLWAQAPEMFRYQGRLVNGTNLVNATLPMSFKLYDSQSGGNLLYEDSSSVLVVDGLYSTTIGDNTVFGSLTNAMTNAAVYLDLTVNGETLSPRERLVSVPYALNASAATHTHERIIGLSGELDCGTIYTGTTITATLTISNDGDGVMMVSGLQYSDNSFSGNWSGKVRAYGSTNITVTFAPVLVKSYSGIITVICDKTSGTNTIVCMGRGVPAIGYVDNGNGTVTDSATGLIWTKNANHGAMSWEAAVAYCSNLVYAGYDDWRLPSVARQDALGLMGKPELDTLGRPGGDPKSPSFSTPGAPFTGVQSDLYWSSTVSEFYNGHASTECAVRMDNGDVWDCGGGSYYVWPVRGGQ